MMPGAPPGGGVIGSRASKEWDMLVPICVDIIVGPTHFCDSFFWTILEKNVTTEMFAHRTCLDASLPLNLFEKPIAQAITKQLGEFTKLLDRFPEDTPLEIALSLPDGSKELIKWNLKNHIISDPNKMLNVDIFATQTAVDLDLPPEYALKIASDIRTQVAFSIVDPNYQKNLQDNALLQSHQLPLNTHTAQSTTTNLANTTTLYAPFNKPPKFPPLNAK
ncbi:hypothetical protein Pelo_274 [Pelomyxa schiedti]|nr:hypothetical protein Pelo_274 [Pelomyxa schiedti]